MANRRPTKGKKRIYRTTYGDAIKTILEKFIKPCLAKLSPGEEESAFGTGIKRFFHTDTRSIYFAKAKRDFTIPGKEWISGHNKRLGWAGSDRRVREGETMVVRVDETMIYRVEVEYGEAIFVMDMSTWKVIKDYVELVA
jgi:hypothetical protein